MKDGEEGCLRELHGGGFAWRIDEREGPALEAVRRALGLWEELAARESSEVLKSNRMRTVVRFDPRSLFGPSEPGPTNPGRWILKQYRHADWPDRVRYRFVASRAEREWTALRRLRELGFAAPRPLAMGERRVAGVPVEGGLVMEEVPQAVSLEEVLAESLHEARSGELPPAAARLLERSGALVRALHEQGLDQPDLHPNNFLLRGDDPGEPAIHVIDLHSARFAKRVSRRRRLAGLTKLVHSLRPAVPREGLRVLVAGYLGTGAVTAGKEALERCLREVESGADRLEARRRRSRSRRCFMPSTAFSVERGPDYRLYLRREVPRSHLPLLFTAAPAAVPIKSDRRGWVARVEAGGRQYLVKRRRYSPVESLRGALVEHRLRRAYRAGFALEVRGVPTPRVLALREEVRLGLVRGAWLITEVVPDGVSLERYLSGAFLGLPAPAGTAARPKRLLAERTGELIRRLHDAGVYSSDLSPQNLIVSPGRLAEEVRAAGGDSAEDRAAATPGAHSAGSGALAPPASPATGRARLWSEERASATPPASAAEVVALADLDSVHLWRRPGLRRRKRNLVQAGNMPEGHVFRSDLLRALHAYARGDPALLSREFIADLSEGLLREAERTLERILRGAREGSR